MAAPLTLGPFTLGRYLDAGAMGQVWLGEHSYEYTPVAIKIITTRRSKDKAYHEQFHQEVRSVAALDHPNIILLLDAGEVPPEVAARSGGKIQSGSPYLVMELSSQGALDKIKQPLPWRTVKHILLSLLDAFAHAHARGVIHRDLKPANVLLGSDIPSRPGLKLTDFGLAHAIHQERTGSTETAVGTPNYMAPEQFEGKWRHYGPWTDLYALGCMAYELVCGHPPFHGDNFWQTAMQHLRADLPALKPIVPIPDHFAAWIQTLLAKAPGQRFQCAADAAWALENLVDPYEIEVNVPGLALPSGGWPSLHRHPKSQDTLSETLTTHPNLALADTLASAPHIPVQHQTPQEHTARHPHPPLPTTWRPHFTPNTKPHLLGAGLALFGLRTLPLIGRQPQRDTLWDTLHKVHNTQRAQLVLLQGPAGVGKTRLATWFAERANEVGGATVLHAHHAPGHEGLEALSRLMAAHMGCLGLTRDETRTHLEQRLRAQGLDDPYEWEALTELILPASADQTPRVRLDKPSQRHVLLARWLQRCADDRPLILHMEDIHFSSPCLAFIDHLLGRQARFPNPILLMVTARDEALAQNPLLAEQLDALLIDEHTQRLHLGPLTPQEQSLLVENLLGLEGELARRIEERSAGNPLFAVQLVGDWVARQILIPSQGGFKLPDGVLIEIPDSLHEVWAARLDQLFSTLDPDAQDALELAAALGMIFPEDAWRQVCERLHLTRSLAMRRALLAQNIAHHKDGRWHFAQTLIRESLERRSRKRQRWATLHQACADALTQTTTSTPAQDARLGHHLLEAQQPEAALLPLWRAVQALVDLGEVRAATRPLGLYERALQDLHVDASDLRRGQTWVMRAQLYVHLGKPHEAIRWGEQAREQAHLYGWACVLPEALLRLAHAHRIIGDNTQASALYRKAMGLYQQSQDKRGQANCLRALAQMRGGTLTPQQRQDNFQQALRLFHQEHDQLAVADCLRGLGQLAERQHNLPDALAMTSRALDLFTKLGNHLGIGLCLNAQAEMARHRGDLEEAAHGYREALRRYEAIGSANIILPRLNLGLVFLARRQWPEAQQWLEDALTLVQRTGRRAYLGGVHSNLLPCAAASQNWSAWDHHMHQSRTLLKETGMVDPDIAWPAALAAQLASDAGDKTRAHEAFTFALAQWQALGNTEKAREVQQQLHALIPNSL